MILAGDVGGTKTHLALFEPDGSRRAPRARAPVPEPRLRRRSRRWSASSWRRPARGRRARRSASPARWSTTARDTTNLPWTHRTATTLGRSAGRRCALLNDLEATAWGVGHAATPASCDAAGRPARGRQPRADRRRHRARRGDAGLGRHAHGGRSPSEGGHADFAPRDDARGRAAASGCAPATGTSATSACCRAPGSPTSTASSPRPAAATSRPRSRARFAAAADPAAVGHRRRRSTARCERARLALERFVAIYGAEAGNLALKALAVGGVFVGGGIAPRILAVLRAGRVRRARSATRAASRRCSSASRSHVILDDRDRPVGRGRVRACAPTRVARPRCHRRRSP